MIHLVFKHLKQQIIFLICCFSFIGYSQELKLSDNAQISILTCGSGDEMYSIFGHTAIRVTDNLSNLDVVYNYGMFDFSTPNFYSKFIKGDLLYSIGTENYQDFLQAYKYYDRSINEQFLNLSLQQKQAIFDKIQHQLASNERFYQYKFIDNNCTTKVVDLLDDVLEKPLDTNFPSNYDSSRNILNSYLQNNYFEKLGINLLFGKKVDKITEEVFLPEKLMESISVSKNGNSNIESNNVLHYQQSNNQKKGNWNTIYFFSIICLILAFLSRIKCIQVIFFGIIGVLGTVILIVSLYTSHTELQWNESLLLFNPLYFLLVFKSIRKKISMALFFFIVLFFILASLDKTLILLPLILLEMIYLVQINRKKIINTA